MTLVALLLVVVVLLFLALFVVPLVGPLGWLLVALVVVLAAGSALSGRGPRW